MINVPRVLTSFIAWKLVFNAGVQRDASKNHSPTEWQRIGNQIDGALTNARPGIVNNYQNENQETQYEKNHIKPKKIRLERKFET